MTVINSIHLERFAHEHFEGIKDKLSDFPDDEIYSLKEVITAKPDKLHEIAIWAKDKTDEYKFMRDCSEICVNRVK